MSEKENKIKKYEVSPELTNEILEDIGKEQVRNHKINDELSEKAEEFVNLADLDFNNENIEIIKLVYKLGYIEGRHNTISDDMKRLIDQRLKESEEYTSMLLFYEKESWDL